MTMNYGTMRESHPVNLSWLPSRGTPYPDNMEILVSPVTIKERRLLEGNSTSQYYRTLLEGITISGAPFKKLDLIYADVQFLDLVRRIYSFEQDKQIYVTGYTCPHCGAEDIKPRFNCTDIEFEDLKEEVFGKEKVLKDAETGEEIPQFIPGKEYKFADGMTVVASPLTVGEYIDLATKYLSNIPENKIAEKMADLYIGEYTYLIKQIPGREFKDDVARREFLEDYLSMLFLDEDQELLDQIEADCTSIMKPVEYKCPECGETVEVYVTPSMKFHK